MYALSFELETFETIPLEDRLDVLRHFLEGLALANVTWLRANPMPLLYESGVVYERQAVGRDIWRDIPRVLVTGRTGDCKILSAWRVAELRLAGERATFFLRRFLIHEKRVDELDYHVQVRRADGTVEDPSEILGMNRPTTTKVSR